VFSRESGSVPSSGTHADPTSNGAALPLPNDSHIAAPLMTLHDYVFYLSKYRRRMLQHLHYTHMSISSHSVRRWPQEEGRRARRPYLWSTCCMGGRSIRGRKQYYSDVSTPSLIVQSSTSRQQSWKGMRAYSTTGFAAPYTSTGDYQPASRTSPAHDVPVTPNCLTWVVVSSMFQVIWRQ